MHVATNKVSFYGIVRKGESLRERSYFAELGRYLGSKIANTRLRAVFGAIHRGLDKELAAVLATCAVTAR